MAHADLRSFLEELERRGRLRRVAAEVDPAGEIACIGRWVRESFPDHEQFALRFDRVRGSAAGVVLGLYSTRELYALALGTSPDRVLDRWSEALEAPRPPRRVDRGPVHEVVETGDRVDLSRVPVPIWTPGRDAGPYIPSAGVITRDPETGIPNMGVYRIQVQGRARTGLFFGTDRQHGAIHLRRWGLRGEPMPVAVVVGGPPAVQFAAAAKTAYGVDEMEIAGGLMGEPVEVVAARTVDLLVPAAAEYVIEGLVRPEARAREGPFGEALGHVNPAADAPVIEVTALCRRRDAVFHGYLQQFPPSEGHLVWEMGVLGCLWYYLRRKMGLEVIRDLAIVPGGAGLSVLAVALATGAGGAAVRRVAAALASVNFGQRIVVLVDEDVDVRDPQTVLWAVSSRADAARDVTINHGVPAYQLDPSILAGLRRGPRGDVPPPPYDSSTMIVDATLRGDVPEISLPPEAEMMEARRRWPSYGLPAPPPRDRLLRLLRHHARPGDTFVLPAAAEA